LQNHPLLKMEMDNYLYQNDPLLPLGGIRNKSMTMNDEEWEVLDSKTLETIRLSLEASLVFNISKEKTMKEFMDTLDKLYEKTLTSNKVSLMKRLFNMNILEVGYIADHLNEFKMDTNQLSYLKVEFHDEVKALLIFWSFPKL
jgi:hypothetical protein